MSTNGTCFLLLVAEPNLEWTVNEPCRNKSPSPWASDPTRKTRRVLADLTEVRVWSSFQLTVRLFRDVNLKSAGGSNRESLHGQPPLPKK